MHQPSFFEEQTEKPGERNIVMVQRITEEIYQYIIQEREMSIYFQPVINMSWEREAGYEALLRASYKGKPVSTEKLFGYARRHEKEKELDDICREKAFEEFCKIQKHGMLFVNFETSLLGNYLQEMDDIAGKIDEMGIRREKIVIEINEKYAEDNDVLIQFATECRNKGFLIALDDVGEGYSNLNRIVLVKPDIVKVDRSVVAGIQNDFYKKEVFRAIAGLAERIGAVVIAEGVEEIQEVFCCLKHGTRLFQGYYFSKAEQPETVNELAFYNICKNAFDFFETNNALEMEKKTAWGHARKEIVRQLAVLLAGVGCQEYETVVTDFLSRHAEIECIYLIDAMGKQVSDTYFSSGTKIKSPYLFSAAEKEDTHIGKPYYYLAFQNREQVYMSESYISAATGYFCQTYAMVFVSKEQKELAICIDYPQ